MGIFDFNFKLADIKTKIKEIGIGYNKKENKILINALDKSTHYHNEIGLTNEAILKLSSEEIGDFIKHRTLLNLKAALKGNPKEMKSYLDIYNLTELAVGMASVTTSHIALTPIPSGDFIESIPKTIAITECPSCGQKEIKRIPWEEKFNKSLEGKESATKPQAYKCDKCGNEFIRYAYI